MQHDPALITDLALLVLLIVAAIVGDIIYNRASRSLPPQQPGDVAGLGRGLATIGCATAISIGLICAVGVMALAVWAGR